MSQDAPAPPKRGRPRSAAARRKALDAAREILVRDGFGRLTIEAVAQASGVGKPTIYRSWSNAQELAMEALLEAAPDAPLPGDGAAPREALTALLSRIVRAFATTRGRQIAMALATADPDSEFTRAFRNRVILESREAGRRLLLSAVARGDLAPPADMDALLDMIFGALMFRLLAGHRPLDPALAHAIVAQVFGSPSGPPLGTDAAPT